MTHYIGSGPYCYANSLAMMLGEAAPPPAVIEVLTGSPFGFELIGGTLPLFDPYGWDPDLVGLGQVRMGVGMLRWQVGQAPAQRARSIWSSRRTW
ncbi:hypothetical protein ACFUNF_42440 [Streptomyces sp. NPDC057291]|uniref:hypothetical protein n=1 Tax=Streptomyces sp. NPDC057291 TaxID=3346087 RepID=UPI003639422E